MRFLVTPVSFPHGEYLFRRPRFIHQEAPAVAAAARVNNPPRLVRRHTHIHIRAPTPSTAVQITTLSQHCLSAFVFSASPPLFPSHVPIPAEPQGPGLKRCRDEGQRDSERERGRERETERERGGLNYSMGMQMSVFYLGGANEGKQALFSRQEQPPCGLWISCSNSEGKKSEHSHSAFFTWGGIKKEILRIQNPQLSEAGAVIK